MRRINEAAQYVPLEDLCLSPQCGFASCECGNKLTEAAQQHGFATPQEWCDDLARACEWGGLAGGVEVTKGDALFPRLASEKR